MQAVERSVIMVLALVMMVSMAMGKQPRFRPDRTSSQTQQLIVAAYKILELGYNCHASGATIEACRAQLQTQLDARLPR
jgi:hypothetical protein